MPYRALYLTMVVVFIAFTRVVTLTETDGAAIDTSLTQDSSTPKPEPEPSKPWCLKLLIWVWNALVDILLVFLIIVVLPAAFFTVVYLIVLAVIVMLRMLPPLAELPGACCRAIGQTHERMRNRPGRATQNRNPTLVSGPAMRSRGQSQNQSTQQRQRPTAIEHPAIPRNLLGIRREAQPPQPVPRKPNHSQQETCAICLESYSREDRVGVLPCLHAFHIACISWALQVRQNCPVCILAVQLSECVERQATRIGETQNATDCGGGNCEVNEATPLLRQNPHHPRAPTSPAQAHGSRPDLQANSSNPPTTARLPPRSACLTAAQARRSQNPATAPMSQDQEQQQVSTNERQDWTRFVRGFAVPNQARH